MDSEQRPLQYKAVTQGLQLSQRIPMLRVGTPHYKKSAQILYAFATGLTVECYCGYKSHKYVFPLSELASNRVCYSEPLVFVS